MSDPITCPECGGKRGQRLGRLFLACRFCQGRGQVGGEHEPAEPCPPPSGPPPVWENPRWQTDPATAVLGCRWCLGARTVTSVDRETRTMTTTPCTACT